MQPRETLSQSINLGPLRAENRLVMPPLVIWKADESGTVTDAHIGHYARSAGPGLMIVEATTVRPEGRLAATQLGVWDDAQLNGLALLATTIRDTGALAGIQIHHAGGSTSLDRTYGLAPRVPSLTETVPADAIELSDDEVVETVEAFRLGVRRALRAGFEVIELHGAHSYLISQFLSPDTNRRTDRWGGSAQARRRFMVAVLEAAREEIDRADRGDSAALTIRLGVAAGSPRALTIDEGLDAARAAVAAGADFLDISNGGGLDDSLDAEIRSRSASILGAANPQSGLEPTPTLLLAALVRDTVDVPVVGVNGIRTPAEAAGAIDSGIADLVATGRAILADPAWAAKALGAADPPIETCRHCKPRCHWFKNPPSCPARARLAQRGEQEPVV
jgi:2,4-dienoyl-CoA reductase-like NADH-dependent reductase (Old Yellow Enzyme family)